MPRPGESPGDSREQTGALFAPAAGMTPEENSGQPNRRGLLATPAAGADPIAAVPEASREDQAREAMLPGENSGTGPYDGGAAATTVRDCPHETPGAWSIDSLLCEGGIGQPPEEWRIQEANRRKQILDTFAEMTARGITKADAAKKVGQGYATIWRWQKRFEKHGFNGLLPDTENCGRKSWLEKLGLTAEQVQALMSEVQGINLDTESVTATLRLFAHSDRCPESLARVILDPTRCSKHAIPPSIRKLAVVPEPVRQAHRGPRRLALKGTYTPRRMDILPGDIFSADDTTPIWAWWVPWIESEEYPFGVKLLQGQFIPVIDVASQCVITFVIIAREKSSYRASDIWHLFGHTFDSVGIPRLGWQLERGSWEANLIRGQEIEVRDGEVTLSRRVGGLRQLPTTITDWHREKHPDYAWPKTLETWTSYLPKSKSIESVFNRMQTFEGTLWGALGRDQMRNPFEKTKKLFQACQRGAEDPRNHFLSGTEIAARLNQLLRYVNSEPMEGEVFKGIPQVNFDSAVKAQPLGYLPDGLRYLYRRDWAVGTKDNPLRVTNGWARVRLMDPAGDRYSLFYGNPEVFAKHEGEPIAVYYDRENFEQPAQIILARTGEFLCEAQYFERVGSFLAGDRTGHDNRKKWREVVMSIYGSLVQHAPSRQLPPEIAARRQASNKPEGTTTVDGRPAPVPANQRPRAVIIDNEDMQSMSTRRPTQGTGSAGGYALSTDDMNQL
jgi:transposase